MKAVIALSGDPLTNGHIDVIKRASTIFKPLVVAIGINPDKKYTFSLEERENLARQALSNLDVVVTSFSGLLIDFAKLNDIQIIIRSVRNTPDYNYEQMLNDINHSQELGVETITLFAKQNLTHVSSSAVKELQKHHGDISEYVPVSIKDALERKISKQTIIGVTGGIGSGKSFVTSKFLDLCKTKNISAHNIDLDQIGRDILTKLDNLYFISIRQRLITEFGKRIMTETSSTPFCINLRNLTNEMFANKENLAIFNSIMKEPTVFQFRQSLNNLTGIIFVNSALLVESDLMYLSNFNIINVVANDHIKKERLIKRGYSIEKIEKVLSSQISKETRINILELQIKNNNYGNVFTLENDEMTEDSIIDAFELVINMYKLS